MDATERMYDVIINEGSKPIKAWTRGVLFEPQAKLQVMRLAQMPFIHNHVAVMPDVHFGKGSTVGSVFATKGAIIPAAVGVDLGCGMMAVQTNIHANELPDNLHEIRTEIKSMVPHGRSDNGGAKDIGAWHDNMPASVFNEWAINLELKYRKICQKHPKAQSYNNSNHLGTLGTGNHFIEVCLDESQMLWVMLHSGSRGLGNKIGTYFIELAKQDVKKWFINLPDIDLAYFPQHTDHFDDYLEAIMFAQDFAATNRDLMMTRIVQAIRRHKNLRHLEINGAVINCHHNYVSLENHFDANVFVTRKGAVRARQSDLAVVPGSMGTKSYIVRGKGNRDSFDSCSHGAGRRMSRGDARRSISIDEHRKALEGIECDKSAGTVDESPQAYKDIDAVIKAEKDLVEVVHTLKADNLY